ARAFFYAGARALLVSHWEVGSDAAVKLTTRAFAEVKAHPMVGRAEALRISMKELIEKGSLPEAHPSQWAPFMVVGEGGALPSPLPTVVTGGLPAQKSHKASAPSGSKPAGKTKTLKSWDTKVFQAR